MADDNHLIPLASATLGVPRDATAEARRTSFLWRLDEADYMPSADVLEAAGTLGVIAREGAGCPVLQARFERDFHDRLDEFAGDYWELDPDDRREEWRELDQLAQSLPKYRARLRDLQAGLDLEWPDDLEENLIPVVDCVQQAFVAPRAVRSDRLAEVAAEEGIPFAELQSRVRMLHGVCPEANPVLATLGLTGKTAPKPASPGGQDAARRKTKIKNTVAASGEKTGMSTPGIVFLVLLGLVGGLLRAGCSGERSQSSISPITYPQLSPPTIPNWDPRIHNKGEQPKWLDIPKIEHLDPFRKSGPVVPNIEPLPDPIPKPNPPRP